jgi:DNA mismatch repair protein MutS
MSNTLSSTPLIQQYLAIKTEHPDALLLFQVGDFYELFFDDAKKASAFLGITLTKRGVHKGEPIPLAGVPVHTVAHYLAKLVRGGFRVVLCDQLEKPQPGKLVERGVSQVLTPGTLTDISLLTEKSASYCAALFQTAQSCGFAAVEILTGQLFVTAFDVADTVHLESELQRFMPDEILISPTQTPLATKAQRLGFVTTLFDPADQATDIHAWFDACQVPARELLLRSPGAWGAIQLLYGYLKKNQELALRHCTQISWYQPDDYLLMDSATQQNLEIIRNAHDGTTTQTLFSVLDRCVTAMGSRMIKKWLVRPLVKHEQINQRLGAVAALVQAGAVRDQFMHHLSATGDLERVVGRIALQRAHIHDYRALAHALTNLTGIQDALVTLGSTELFRRLLESIGDFTPLHEKLTQALCTDQASDWKIRAGYHAPLDQLRLLAQDGARALADFELREQQRTGIGSLKVRYNRAQGYALEVTHANKNAVPTGYILLQSLTNRDRYTNDKLKKLEYDIVNAQQESLLLEEALYADLCAYTYEHVPGLKKMANALAYTDALIGFARAAYEQNFTRPIMHKQRNVTIQEGRHPVVASTLGHSFIPNNTLLTPNARTWVITGPNMGGKSTYLRQVALIAVMAQSGSFVPATQATLPIFDRIFTRIGARDRVAAGKSTFLVEMEETALIVTNATSNSLVILDEVGRGTSTYDGLAIAQSVLEYIHEKIGAYALFATHYHELTALQESHPGIICYHAASTLTDQGLVLLYKILPGAADGSFGLEVARMVQLHPDILARAEQLLHGFRTLNQP